MSSTLQRIKAGKSNYKLVNFPGTEEKVALVILSSNEITMARIKAEEFIKENNIEDEDYKELAMQQQIVFRALRDKDDITKRLAENFDEFMNLLDNVEIQYLMVQYSMFTTETSPFLNSVSDEQFEQLKKTLEKTQLNDLSGPSVVALRNFLMTLA